MGLSELLRVWRSLAAYSAFLSEGRSISPRPLEYSNNLSADILSGSVVKVLLPTSLTNGQLVSEQHDKIEILINSSRLYGTECPGSGTQLPVNAPGYARSNCPWYYKLQRDPNRFPTSLPVAISKCKRQCLGLHEDVADDFTCDYVYHDVTVLVREYRNKIPSFIEKVEHIPVGSTCVRKKESTQI